MTQETEPQRLNAPIQAKRAELVSSQPQMQEPSNGEAGVSDVDLSFLDLPSEAPKETQQAQADQNTPEFKAFAEQFKQFSGVEFQEAINTLNDLRGYRQAQIIAEQKRNLQQAWGVDEQVLNQRLQLVQERFNKYPKAMQAQLDNEEGARLIWAKLQLEQQDNTPPKMDRAKATVPASGKYMFSESQIQKMSDTEYKQNVDRITYAYKNGLVANN